MRLPSSSHLTLSGDLATRKLDRSLFKPSTSTRKYRAKDGSMKFQGNGKSLKETQVYPPSFGRKVTHLSLVLLVPGVNIDICNPGSQPCTMYDKPIKYGSMHVTYKLVVEVPRVTFFKTQLLAWQSHAFTGHLLNIHIWTFTGG